MAFEDALYDDECELEGVRARRGEDAVHLADIAAEPDCVAVTPLQLSDLLALRRIQVLIDARLKPAAATPDYRRYVGLSVGLGGHFAIGENCDLAFDAAPAHCAALSHCTARQPCENVVALDDPALVLAPARGTWHTPLDIGDSARRGDLIGRIGEFSVRAQRDGLIIGLARDGLVLPEGAPVAEIARKGTFRARCSNSRAKALAKTALTAIQDELKLRSHNHDLPETRCPRPSSIPSLNACWRTMCPTATSPPTRSGWRRRRDAWISRREARWWWRWRRPRRGSSNSRADG